MKIGAEEADKKDCDKDGVAHEKEDKVAVILCKVVALTCYLQSTTLNLGPSLTVVVEKLARKLIGTPNGGF